jgi:hypothetical protein
MLIDRKCCDCSTCNHLKQLRAEIVLFVTNYCNFGMKLALLVTNHYNFVTRLHYLFPTSTISRCDCTTCYQPVQSHTAIALLVTNQCNLALRLHYLVPSSTISRYGLHYLLPSSAIPKINGVSIEIKDLSHYSSKSAPPNSCGSC